MRIAVLAETDAAEPRVAATPETVKKFVRGCYVLLVGCCLIEVDD